MHNIYIYNAFITRTLTEVFSFSGLVVGSSDHDAREQARPLIEAQGKTNLIIPDSFCWESLPISVNKLDEQGVRALLYEVEAKGLRNERLQLQTEGELSAYDWVRTASVPYN